MISEDYAHASLVNSVKTWWDMGEQGTGMAYFDGHLGDLDPLSPWLINLRLWTIGNAALGFIDLISRVGSDLGYCSMPEAVEVRMAGLWAEDTRLREQIRSTARKRYE
jgi:hypothetical protein